jgi:hypothetical protein
MAMASMQAALRKKSSKRRSSNTRNFIELVVLTALVCVGNRSDVESMFHVFNAHHISNWGIAYIAGFIITVYEALWALISTALDRDASIREVLLRLVYCFLYTLVIFTALYFAFGTRKNFLSDGGGTYLSHFQAFYFALGTLGTGTGDISARSELMQCFQAIQMTVDLVLIVIAATLATNRFGSRAESAKTW